MQRFEAALELAFPGGQQWLIQGRLIPGRELRSCTRLRTSKKKTNNKLNK